MALKYFQVVVGAVAVGNDRDARLEGLAIEGAGGGYNGDGVARAERSCFMKYRLRSQMRAGQSDKAFRSRISEARPRSS